MGEKEDVKHMKGDKNQKLKRFLVLNEDRYVTEEFFKFLESQKHDCFKLRYLTVIDEYDKKPYKYAVVFGEHFVKRIGQRFGVYGNSNVDAAIDELMSHMSDAVSNAVTANAVMFDGEEIVPVDGQFTETGVYFENYDVIPVFMAGNSYILCCTVVKDRERPLRKSAQVIHEKDLLHRKEAL